MISRNVIRQSLKTLAPAMFLLVCFSITAFAQSPAEAQDSVQKDRTNISFNSPVKAAIDTLGKQLKLNVVFDDSVKDERLTLELKDVTVKQTMKIILIQKKLQARTIEENTIIIFPDNEANRERYGQYEIWPAKSDATK
ncbi:MAG: STN domain-containing protein [Acidobacteria bacterium]|nr:STN domain-containing protein [Acidobacteriota bacterium]